MSSHVTHCTEYWFHEKSAILRIFWLRRREGGPPTQQKCRGRGSTGRQTLGIFNCRGILLLFCEINVLYQEWSAQSSRSKQSKLTHFLLPDQWGVVLRLLLLFHFLLLVKINLCALLQQPRGQHYLLRHQPRVHISGRGSGHDGLNLKRQQRGWTSNAPRLQSRRFWSCTPHYLGLRPRKFRPSWQWLLGHWAIGVGPNARHQ